MTALSATPAADPFPTLTELLEEHAELQADLDTEEKVKGAGKRVSDFVDRAVATGALLDARDDRKEAQAVINYWVSVASAADLPVAPCARLAPERPDLLDAAIAAATTKQSGWGEDRPLARRVLLRMVRLTADDKLVLTPVRRESLDDLEPQATVDRLLVEFETSGVVRRSARSDGTEEFSLRSPELLESWPFLWHALIERKKFRRRADEWARAGTPQNLMRREPNLLNRWLSNVGKRVNAFWDWALRRVGGARHMTLDPAAEFPDVDFYRDRTPVEMVYLFARREKWKVAQERVRVIKGMVLFGFVVTVVAGAVLVVLKMRGDNERAEEVRAAKESARDFELKKRRDRQRLKEHVALVRLISQYHVFIKNPRDLPRAEVAEWRAAGILDGLGDEAGTFCTELAQIEVMTDGVGGRVCASCSEPLTVAQKLAAVVMARAADDRDTDIYRHTLILQWYTSVVQLTEAMEKALDGTGPDRYRTFEVLGGYMSEFWVLYYGEMAIVENEAVAGKMIEYGKRMNAVDAEFGKQLAELAKSNKVPEAKLSTLGKVEGKAATPPLTTTAKAYQLKGETNGNEWEVARNQYFQQTLPVISKEDNKTDLAKAVNALREQRKLLVDELNAEMATSRAELARLQKPADLPAAGR